MPSSSEGKSETYINPVYPHSFPDPFVLKFRGEYFAFCTGDADDGNVFGILRSRDLVDWSYVGSAMEPIASRPPFYWAPEVIYDNGKFYIYYSAGNEVLMEIRVAVSDRPDGGFVDAGVRLTKEEFAIDAHVFIDDDGQRYMFYATDFLEYSHIGTGTVVDRMIDLKTLEGDPRPVTRAKYDWQVYDPARKEKGGVRWYTVEGPTVLKRKQKYFEMFSGGNWQNKTYGVSFAMTDSIKSTDEWQQFSDGEKILPILRTIPDKVIGPGHNSVVRGPNNRELFCIYHRWTEAGRVLAIDRMDFAGDRLFVTGPTTTKQPAPFQPLKNEQILQENLDGWSLGNDEFISSPDEKCELAMDLASESFLLEFTFKLAETSANGRFAIEIGETRFELAGDPVKATLRSDAVIKEIEFPADFDLSAWHLIRAEKNGTRCRVMIDDISRMAEVRSASKSDKITISSRGFRTSVSAIELTQGFEELFESHELPDRFQVDGKANVSHGRLILKADDGHGAAAATMAIVFAEFEIAVNIAADSNIDEYGVKLFDRSRTVAVAQLIAHPQRMTIEFTASAQIVSIDLPDSFAGNEFRQFRLLSQSGRLFAYLDGILLSDLVFDAVVGEAAIYGTGKISVEMVRVTAV